MTGVDRSAFLLDRARSYARTENVDVEWVQKDMRDFRRPHTFDLAISIYTSFGYFDDAEESQRVWVRDSSARQSAFGVWIYSGSELTQMFLKAGFGSVWLLGHLDGRPYDVNARRLVAAATTSV